MTQRLAAAVFLTLLSTVGEAHHSPANFDTDVTDFSVTGTITYVDFRNPHSVIELSARDPSGQSLEWQVEFSSVNLLLRRGWEFDRIKIGDMVTCIGNPSRSGAEEMYMWEIRLEDGTEFGR